ncbi:hypothetical protein Ciccas_000999 [Cichlidogyrus casuarinus]|uniref:Uncharacterized protein n=1 Tax=Cichlidogyrus casuarinus TaxID=1844966 RepID=A0ABD2QLL6_9PLAT
MGNSYGASDNCCGECDSCCCSAPPLFHEDFLNDGIPTPQNSMCPPGYEGETYCGTENPSRYANQQPAQGYYPNRQQFMQHQFPAAPHSYETHLPQNHYHGYGQRGGIPMQYQPQMPSYAPIRPNFY